MNKIVAAAVVFAWMLQPVIAPAREPSDAKLLIGGNGGVYLLAEPGELTIDLFKRDLNNRGSRADLRAILLGPDRKVLDEVTIPDDGRPRGDGPGPIQRKRLSTTVERKGVYALNVTTATDRYGREIVWGFDTNCPRYLIETSRGHKDERHQEPIVLARPDGPADVCFLPRAGSLAMDVANLPNGVDELTVFDGNGEPLATLPVRDGRASHAFAADVPRDEVPWRLHLPVGRATVNIDGVTRWDSADAYPNLSLWTPEATSTFPLAPNRWLLTPYSRNVFGRSGEQREIVFNVHNNSTSEKTVRLELEFPGAVWPAELSEERVTLAPKQSRDVAMRCTVGAKDATLVCHVRATPENEPEFSTYSTLTIRSGSAPASEPIDVPLVLKPYRHENEQFGYLPDYPIDAQVYFGPANRPFVRTAKGIASVYDGRWTSVDLRNGYSLSKVAFDRDGDVYVLGKSGRRHALLHSTDGGRSFSAFPIPGRTDVPAVLDFEQFSGHNTPDGPPPIVRFTRTASDPKRIWRRIHDLELLLAEKTDAGLAFGEPILLSRQCIGLSAHSGIPSSVVSRGTKVHVAWGEATDPEVDVPGVPTFVATCDRRTRTVGKPALVGYGPPANDIHNSPTITIDSRGYLHVLVGTHGRPFPYARSIAPNDAHAGWTKPVPMGEDARQTYIGLVCGPDDTLHAVFRLWRSGTEPFPASHHGTLAYQRKRPGEPWGPPRVLIVPPFSEYSVYYHRLTIDRRGRLFLSYDYWSTYWFYRNDHRGNRRALMTSPDGGQTWKLAEDRDFVRP